MDLNKDQPEKKVLTPSSTNAANLKMKGFVPITDSNSLESKDSNFIFFFGKPSIGKSVILASMMYYMNARAGTLRPKKTTPNTHEAEVLFFDMLDNIKRGILPKRSTVDQVTRIDMIFEPKNTAKKVQPVSLTFLEMSGEDLQMVRRGGSFNTSIDEYLNADIPLSFILVTDFDNADEDDSLMLSFLNELEKKPRKFTRINAILLVAKWDKSGQMNVPSGEHLEDFIASHMPMTNNQMDQYELTKSFYTVGNVQKDDKGGEQLSELNLGTAKMLTEWLYESITGVDLNYPGTFWEQLFRR